MIGLSLLWLAASPAIAADPAPGGSAAASVSTGASAAPAPSGSSATPVAVPDVATLSANALRLWSLREDPRQAAAAIKALEAWSAAAPRDAKPLILLSRACYWYALLLASGGEQKARLALLSRGLEAGRKAATLAPKDPGGDYWAATNLGTYGKLYGVTKSVSSLGEIRERLNRVATLDPAYFHGGVWRYHGRVIDQVPGALRMMHGYSLDDAVNFYRKAVSIEPKYLQNYVFLGECLLQKGQKEEARKVLSSVVRADANGLPDAIPENKLSQRMAKDLLRQHFPESAAR